MRKAVGIVVALTLVVVARLALADDGRGYPRGSGGTGTANFSSSVTSPTGKFATIDAGAEDIQGQLSVAGPIIGASTLTIATIDAGQGQINGALQVNGTLTGASETLSGTLTVATLDAGQGQINGAFQVNGALTGASETLTGTLTAATVDAGQGQVNGALQVTGPLRVNARPVAVALPLDGGSPANVYVEYGWAALSTGAITVTFKNAFTVGPICTCTHLNTTNSNACVVTAQPTTTQVAMAVTSGSSDLVYYHCIGDR